MNILVADDDQHLNKGICAFLESRNLKTFPCYHGKAALEKIKTEEIDLLISDLQMPEIDGMSLLKEIQETHPQIPVIIMTAFASVENAVEAMKLGAEDYLTKPINLKELILKIEKIVKNQKLMEENKNLKEKLSGYEIPEIIGTSDEIERVKDMLKKISINASIPVMIYGESGTGKELVARNIHLMSERNKMPFVPINCAVLSEELMESELFGHKKGAYTGAEKDKIGLLESCDKGTIFLDEISEMSPRVQSKFLRVLQDGMIQPLGSNKMKYVDIRFICASNKRLSSLVEKNQFRDDLYFRLNVIELDIPNLKSRKGDIPILIRHFFEKYGQTHRYMSKEVLNVLENFNWPGNIRELENLIRMLSVTTSSSRIDLNDLPEKFMRNVNESNAETIDYSNEYKFALNQAVFDFEKKYIEYHLRKNNYNISKTAESINLSRVSLHKKIKEFSITAM